MAWLLLASSWCLLLLAGALAPWLGGARALVGGHAACALLLLWARPKARERAPLGPAFVAAASGFVALPAWLVGVGTLGLGLGLAAPAPLGAEPFPGGVWLAHVALAPTFEELLYRERLLPALSARIGRSAALVVSSALFALPHLGAWSMLATFCVGLFLGILQLVARRVALAIGYHAGANAAALFCGVPPARMALDATSAALASSLLVVVAVAWTRSHGSRPRIHAGAR